MKFLGFFLFLSLSCYSFSKPSTVDYGNTSDRSQETTVDSSQQNHYDVSTSDPLWNITTNSESWTDESSTKAPLNFCKFLYVMPGYLTVSPGGSASIKCTCRFAYSFGEQNCPEWRGINNVLHLHRRIVTRNACHVTLELRNVTSETPKLLTCSDVNSFNENRLARINLKHNNYDEQCQINDDCHPPLQCRNSKCGCPGTIYIPGSPGTCYPARNPLQSCIASVQCQGADKNALCYRDGDNRTGSGICLCREGYEIESGKCVCEEYGIRYVYTFTRRYQTVFYVLLSISMLLIFIGLMKLCLMRKRGPPRKPGFVVQDLPQEESSPTPRETEKMRY